MSFIKTKIMLHKLTKILVFYLSLSFVISLPYKHGHDSPTVSDLKLVSSKMKMMDVTKDASFDCWLKAVNNVESQAILRRGYDLFENNEELHLSPGGSFCAMMKSRGQLDSLAFELTKCEYERFNDRLPIECSFENADTASGINTDGLLRQCMSSLSNETWLAIFTTFTQYKLSSYSICTKLTEDLVLYRQKAAAIKLEETIGNMEEKIGHVLSRADSQLEQIVSSTESRMIALKRDIEVDMKDIMYMEMKAVQEMNEEMKRKLEESATKIEDHFNDVTTEIFERTELKFILDVTSRVKATSSVIHKKWIELKMFGHSIFMIIIIIMITRHKRLIQARSTMLILNIVGAIVILNVKDSSSIDNIKKEAIISMIRCSVPFIYGIIIITTLFKSYFIASERSNNFNQQHQQQNPMTSNVPIVDSSYDQIHVALDNMRMEIEKDKESRREEQEQFKHMISVNMNNLPAYDKSQQLDECFNTNCHYNPLSLSVLNPYHHHNQQQHQLSQPPYVSPLLQRYPNNKNDSFLLPKSKTDFKTPRQSLDLINGTREKYRSCSGAISPCTRFVYASNMDYSSGKSSSSIELHNVDNNESKNMSDGCMNLQFWTPSPSPIPQEDDESSNSTMHDTTKDEKVTNEIKKIATHLITEEKKARKRKNRSCEDDIEYVTIKSSGNYMYDQDSDNKKQKTM